MNATESFRHPANKIIYIPLNEFRCILFPFDIELSVQNPDEKGKIPPKRCTFK